MAEISPVRDPNYENFQYSALLNQATDPLRTLGAGRLALAQQQGQRMFDLQRDRQISDLAGDRELQRLNAEASIRENERLKLKNEAAQSMFATVQQRHPEWKPDPKKSLAENVASAQAMSDEDTMQGVNALGNIQSKALDEKKAILAKYGAFQAPDPTLVNRQLTLDPSLTTGHFPVLGPKQIQMLNAGKTPEEVAKTFDLTSNQEKLLNAAQTARAAVQERQQQIAATKAQVELQAIDSKYSPYNQLSTDLLSSLSKTQPWLLGKAASLLGRSTNADLPSGLGANGLRTDLMPPPPADGSTNSASGDVPVPAGTPALMDPNYHTHKALLDAAQKDLQANQDIADNLGQQLMKGGRTIRSYPQPTIPAFGGIGFPSSGSTTPTETVIPFSPEEAADVAKQRLDALKKVEKAKKDIAEHSQMIQSIQDANKPPAASPMPGNVPNQPPALLPTAPSTIQQPAGQPSAMNGQLSPFDMANGINQATRALGTTDPTTLQKAVRYATTQLGMSQSDIQNLVQSALRGDQASASKARQIIAQANGGGTQSFNGFSYSDQVAPGMTFSP